MRTPSIYSLAAAKSRQLCPTLCDPIEGSPLGSPVPGILQARTPEWVAISFSNAGKWKVKVKVKSCLTPSDPMDYSLPGSSIHGIFQARVLEWGAIAFSVRQPRDTQNLNNQTLSGSAWLKMFGKEKKVRFKKKVKYCSFGARNLPKEVRR